MCNSSALEEFVRISNRSVSHHVQQTLCSSPKTWLNQAEDLFLDNLDFLKAMRVRTHTQTHTHTHTHTLTFGSVGCTRLQLAGGGADR